MGKILKEERSLATLKGILFDWDGTVVDSFQALWAAQRFAYRQHVGIDFPRDEEEFRRVSPMRLAESTALYAGAHANEVAASYIWYYTHEGYKLSKLFAGIPETWLALRRRGYRVGVVTNTSLARMSVDLEFLHPDGMLDVIVTSEDTRERKPHPGPLLKAAEKLEMPPGVFAYVGDYAGDMVAARAAGMLAVAALWGGIFPSETLLAQLPDYAVESPKKLLDLFR
jgi:HAD superfamily hydrolase (TIGR01549 family)